MRPLLLLLLLPFVALPAQAPRVYFQGSLMYSYQVRQFQPHDPKELMVKLTTFNPDVEAFSITVRFTNGKEQKVIVPRSESWATMMGFWLLYDEIEAIACKELAPIGVTPSAGRWRTSAPEASPPRR